MTRPLELERGAPRARARERVRERQRARAMDTDEILYTVSEAVRRSRQMQDEARETAKVDRASEREGRGRERVCERERRLWGDCGSNCA